MTRLFRWLVPAFLLPSPAFAELAIERVQADGDLAVDVRLDGAPGDGTTFTAKAPGDDRPTTAVARPLAQDLWLLVDSSTLCQAQQVDGYVNRLVRAVRKQAASDTRVTLVTYTSETSDVLLRDAAPAALEEAHVECERRPMSSSYDAPLARLLAEKKPQDRPLAVWVFTAGNLELSRTTAQALAQRGAELDVVLYNAFIEKDVRPMWQAAQAKLGGLRARLSVLAKPDGAVSFPSERFALRFSAQSAWIGKRTVLTLSALGADGRAVAKAEVLADLPLGGWARFWRRFGRLIATVVSLGLLAAAIYRMVGYYRAPRCARCLRRVSYRLNHCLFCEVASTAFLVGDFRRHTDGFGRGSLPTVVLPLVTPTTEVGTHRRSVIQFPPAGKRQMYFQIRREDGARGARYRLERAFFGRKLDVRVNGVLVADERYLASGDEIRVGDTSMVFRYGGETHAS